MPCMSSILNYYPSLNPRGLEQPRYNSGTTDPILMHFHFSFDWQQVLSLLTEVVKLSNGPYSVTLLSVRAAVRCHLCGRPLPSVRPSVPTLAASRTHLSGGPLPSERQAVHTTAANP